MGLNWYECLIYGLLSGITELLPISSQAHRELFLLLTGTTDHVLLRICTRVGILIALILAGLPILSRLHRERRIASLPRQRRKRRPDTRSILELRFLRIAVIPLVVLIFAAPVFANLGQRLWVLAGLLLLNGIILYVPQFLYRGNKDVHSFSGMDSLLTGFAMGLGIIPGISAVGTAISAGLARGAEQRYILDMSLLLLIPFTFLWVISDCFGLPALTSVPNFTQILSCVGTMICSFASASAGIFAMRFLAVKVGFSGFSYYCWGMALLTFFLYLI